MKKPEFLKTINSSFHRMSFKVKQHSPEILLGFGIASGVATVVVACTQTTKISKILDKAKEDLTLIHENVGNTELSEEYTVEDSKKDLVIVYSKTAIDLVKLYAPAIILGGLSVTCILASNGILRKRNFALLAAYTAIDTSFKGYRARVKERYGEDVDTELRFDIKPTKFEETVLDENGKEKKVKNTVMIANKKVANDYARYFIKGVSEYYEDNQEYNLMFLRAQQDLANRKLKEYGHLFLNEVYEMLGIEKVFPYGQFVGWIFDKNNTAVDNVVDFRLYDSYNVKSNESVTGNKKAILLDFNVDGYILDKLQND